MEDMYAVELDQLKRNDHTEFDLSFENITYGIKNKQDGTHTTILKNLSGAFRSGRLTGILGPSGAGKSTFLNVLSGFKKFGVVGQLKVDGQRISERRNRKVISYTPQEVTLWLSLTVEESLMFAAEFKLSMSISLEEKRNRVSKLLEILGLENCAKTQVKKISGGQAKRLSIGVELVSDPKVMLLDEPTSGLDTVSSYQVMSYVRRLALKGRVIACVIHQPSSQLLRLFDDLFVLSKGRRVYSGPVATMVNKFQTVGLECPRSYNPADFALEVASRDQQDESLKQLIMEGETETLRPYQLLISEKSLDVPYERYALSTAQQLRVLLKRTTLCTARDSYQFKARFIISVAIALITSVAFYDTGNNADKILANTAVLIIILYGIQFTSAASAVLVYPRESAAFVQESKNNWYSLKAYYYAKLIVELPTLILSTSTFYIIIYYFTSQPLEMHRIAGMWLIALMFGWVSQMQGLLFGSMLSMQNSVFMLILSTILFSLSSGFFVLLKDASIVVKPLLYISYVRYAFEGALNAIYGFDRKDLECPEFYCYFGRLQSFLKFVSMPQLHYQYDVLGLFAWMVISTGALYFSLRRRIRKE